MRHLWISALIVASFLIGRSADAEPVSETNNTCPLQFVSPSIDDVFKDSLADVFTEFAESQTCSAESERLVRSLACTRFKRLDAKERKDRRAKLEKAQARARQIFGSDTADLSRLIVQGHFELLALFDRCHREVPAPMTTAAR